MADLPVYSVLGVGFGPANLSLAVALDEFAFRGSRRYLEAAPGFQWQDEQLLPGTDIQNNPLRDLVMPRKPDSPYTFVNYLTGCGKLLEYLHLNAKFALRREYAGYLGWVAAAFNQFVDYGQPVGRLRLVRQAGRELFEVASGTGRRYLGETVVIGTGRSPRIPAVFGSKLGPSVFHSTRYLSSIEALRDERLRVAVIGASQSAIEIVLDLLDRPNVAQVMSIQRSIGFRLKDTSPYSRRVFLPEFVDYFHPLPPETRSRIRAELRSINYAACDQDVIDKLASIQHEYRLTGSDRLRLMPFSEVSTVAAGVAGSHRMVVTDVNYRTETVRDADVIILATGFRDFGTGPDDERCHPLLNEVLGRLTREDTGVPVVERDYSVPLTRQRYGPRPPRLFLNGLCEASHGMGDAGALAMLSVRSTDIGESIMRGPAGAGRATAPERIAVGAG